MVASVFAFCVQWPEPLSVKEHLCCLSLESSHSEAFCLLGIPLTSNKSQEIGFSRKLLKYLCESVRFELNCSSAASIKMISFSK